MHSKELWVIVALTGGYPTMYYDSYEEANSNVESYMIANKTSAYIAKVFYTAERQEQKTYKTVISSF
jgi:hypothetical protein